MATTTTAFEAELLALYPNPGSRDRGLQAGATYKLRQNYLAGMTDPAAHTAAKSHPAHSKALTDSGKMASFDAITAP